MHRGCICWTDDQSVSFCCSFQCFLWKSIIILTNTNRGCSILLCQMTNMSTFHFDFAFLWLLSNLIRLLYHLQFTILQSNIRNSGSIYSAFQVSCSSQCKSSKQIFEKFFIFLPHLYDEHLGVPIIKLNTSNKI